MRCRWNVQRIWKNKRDKIIGKKMTVTNFHSKRKPNWNPRSSNMSQSSTNNWKQHVKHIFQWEFSISTWLNRLRNHSRNIWKYFYDFTDPRDCLLLNYIINLKETICNNFMLATHISNPTVLFSFYLTNIKPWSNKVGDEKNNHFLWNLPRR